MQTDGLRAERRAVLCCSECTAELRGNDECFSFCVCENELLLCEDCFDGWCRGLRRSERAELMGIKRLTAEEALELCR